MGEETPTIFRQISPFQYLRDGWAWILGGAFLSFEFAGIMMLGWPRGLLPSIRLPYVFAGDALAIQWLGQRSIEGWIFNNPRSGFPFGSNFTDYPGSDSGSFLIYKLLGLASRSGAYDLFFLLSFPACFISAFVVFRSFEIRRAYSFCAAMLFAFAPFHFARFFMGHDLYLWYFGVPIFFYHGRNLFVSGVTFKGLGSLTSIVSLAPTVAALSCFGVYYAFFGTILLVVCGIASSLRNMAFKPVLNAVLLCAVISVGVGLNLVPNAINRIEHGPNPEVATRRTDETERFGLKIIHLLLPQPDHRIKALGDFSTSYAETFPLSNTVSSVGVAGTIGFVVILVTMISTLAGKRPSPYMGFATAVTICLLLVSTVGGLDDLFALLVTPIIRGWDRISIFVDFAVLLAFAMWIDGLETINRRPVWTALTAVIVTTLGLLDQTPTSYKSVTQIAARRAAMDADFVHRIETLLPDGAAIYQLPYIPFPESAQIFRLYGYEPAIGFINSKVLKWSFGGMAGRPGDLFYRDLAKQPVTQQIVTIRKMGFSGVYIDRRGYADNGSEIVNEFTKALGHGPALTRADGEIVCFKIS
jgi:phosphoglycerol transferase